ncbi:MAG: phosphoribosylglycinamide formyltransferase [Clostridiales bacterium]|nr:phosphoribosylglycinamide formyltransferase [Clostridiales bacterium]
MLKIAALVSGGGTNLQAILDAMDSGIIKNAEISIVVSTNGHAYALKRAEIRGINTVVLAKKDFANNCDREKALLDILSQNNIELVVLCGCMMVLSPAFIEGWDKPIINVHPSLLPAHGGRGFYGLRVHEAVLAAGDAITGATVHFVDGGIDTGSIILQKEVAVKMGDTPEILQKRVMEQAEWIILPQAIAEISEKFGR